LASNDVWITGNWIKANGMNINNNVLHVVGFISQSEIFTMTSSHSHHVPQTC
jgi:hypothetical protein